MGLSQDSGTRLLFLKMNNKAVWTDGELDTVHSRALLLRPVVFVHVV